MEGSFVARRYSAIQPVSNRRVSVALLKSAIIQSKFARQKDNIASVNSTGGKGFSLQPGSMTTTGLNAVPPTQQVNGF